MNACCKLNECRVFWTACGILITSACKKMVIVLRKITFITCAAQETASVLRKVTQTILIDLDFGITT